MKTINDIDFKKIIIFLKDYKKVVKEHYFFDTNKLHKEYIKEINILINSLKRYV